MRVMSGARGRLGSSMGLAGALLALVILGACSGESGSGTPDADIPGDVLDLDGDDGTGPGELPRTDTVTDGIGDTGDNVPQDPLVATLVEQGKTRLSAGESLSAMDSFQRALERAPDHQEALWGVVLARFQATVSMFGSMVGLINFKEDPDLPPPDAAGILWAQWPEQKGTIGMAIDSMARNARIQQDRLETLMAGPGNPVFTLDGGLPLHFGSHPMMHLCCEWDLGDLYGISSFNRLMLAFVSFLGSQDSHLSLDRVYALFKKLPGISNVLVAAMDEYPDFLTLLPEGGADTWRSVKDHLEASIRDAQEAVRLMEAGNDLERNVATLSDGPHAYLVLHGTFPGDRTELQILWEGAGSSLKDVVQRTQDHLAGQPGNLLSLDQDVLVALGVLLDILNRTVGFGTVIRTLGFDLPDVLANIVEMLDPDDPEQLVGILKSLTLLVGIQPGAVALDLASFLANPFNLRDFLPNAGPDPGTGHRTFLKSFECARGGLLLAPQGDGYDGTVFLHDPSATAPQVDLTVAAFEDPLAQDAIFDQTTITLQPIPGFTGLYSGTLAIDPPGIPNGVNDETLRVPDGGAFHAVYVSPANPEVVVNLGGTLPDGVTPWDYGAACAEDAVGWDGTRFAETEFAGAVEVTAPGQHTPLVPVNPDGRVGLSGQMAFKSPSFAGLIHVKEGEGYVPADQASFAALIQGVLSALEGF